MHVRIMTISHPGPKRENLISAQVRTINKHDNFSKAFPELDIRSPAVANTVNNIKGTVIITT